MSARIPARSSSRALAYSNFVPCCLRSSPTRPPIQPLRPKTRKTCRSDRQKSRCWFRSCVASASRRCARIAWHSLLKCQDHGAVLGKVLIHCACLRRRQGAVNRETPGGSKAYRLLGCRALESHGIVWSTLSAWPRYYAVKCRASLVRERFE